MVQGAVQQKSIIHLLECPVSLKGGTAPWHHETLASDHRGGQNVFDEQSLFMNKDSTGVYTVYSAFSLEPTPRQQPCNITSNMFVFSPHYFR